MCWDELLSVEVEYGKLQRLPSPHLDRSEMAPVFVRSLFLKYWNTEPSFLFVVGLSYTWWVLYSGGAQGCAWTPLWGCGIWGAGLGKANPVLPLIQARHAGSSSSCRGCSGKASWGIAEISPARQGCKQGLQPCSCSRRSLCGGLVEDTQQYRGSGDDETNV